MAEEESHPRGPDFVECLRGSSIRTISIFCGEFLEQAASNTNQRDPVTQKIGDFYAPASTKRESRKSGLDPIKPELEAIARMNSVRELAPLVARLQMVTGGYRSILFRGGRTRIRTIPRR